MGFKYLIGISIGLIFCSCNYLKPTAKTLINSGLLIESGPPQGMRLTDSVGIAHGFTTITSIITNDSTVPIQIEIGLGNTYAYATPYGDQQYTTILIPEDLTPDTATLFNLNKEKIKAYLESGLYTKPHRLMKTLRPQETYTVTLGILRPSCKNCGVIPKVLFTANSGEKFKDCNWLTRKHLASNSPWILGLKISTPNACKLINCGQISYPTR